MHILLLIFYGILASFGIWKIPFLRNSGIRPVWLWILYVLHVFTGWLHNWIAWRYFPEHGDVWNYFSLSFLYRHRLLSEFHLFLLDNSTWTYITHNGIVYVHLLLNLLSGDDMRIDTLLFAFPVFLGSVALYRVFRRRFNGDGLAAGSVLWLPSVIFWTSCIYREGMLFMLLGFLFFELDRWFASRSRRALFVGVILFLLIAYFRLAVAAVLIPALLVWGWFERPITRLGSRHTKSRLTVIIGIALIAALAALVVPAVRNPVLQAVTTEQVSFLMLQGHSRLSLPALDGSLASFWRALPYAIRNGFFEPIPGSGGQAVYLIFAAELVVVWLCVLSGVVTMLRGGKSSESNWGEFAAIRNRHVRSPSFPLARVIFALACVIFALAGMLLIGFVVPFAGTIVRYRSIYLPFLLAPALHALGSHPAVQRLKSWSNNKLHFLI